MISPTAPQRAGTLVGVGQSTRAYPRRCLPMWARMANFVRNPGTDGLEAEAIKINQFLSVTTSPGTRGDM